MPGARLHRERGVDRHHRVRDHAFQADPSDETMNQPTPRPQPRPQPTLTPQRRVADEQQIRNWLRLRDEMAELHARLEYLRLMVSLGVS